MSGELADGDHRRRAGSKAKASGAAASAQRGAVSGGLGHGKTPSRSERIRQRARGGGGEARPRAGPAQPRMPPARQSSSKAFVGVCPSQWPVWLRASGRAGRHGGLPAVSPQRCEGGAASPAGPGGEMFSRRAKTGASEADTSNARGLGKRSLTSPERAQREAACGNRRRGAG